jgi:hypothetical protein
MNFIKRLRLDRLCILLSLGFAASEAGAHEDLDIGIASVTLNKQCQAVIEVKNFGRDLPESFYQVVRPAYLVLEKGEKREEMKSLRTLDRKRQLARTGGTLTVISRHTYANNPKPVDVQILLEGEWVDYGAANDRRRESMDCVPGQGQIAGDAIPDTQPDIYVETARIDPESCTLEVTFGNLSSVGLVEQSWGENGAFLMTMTLPAHERQADIPLLRLDPQKQFTRSQPLLTWRAPVPRVDVERWRVGMWQVLNERDFPNNQIEIPMPEACRATPR